MPPCRFSSDLSSVSGIFLDLSSFGPNLSLVMAKIGFLSLRLWVPEGLCWCGILGLGEMLIQIGFLFGLDRSERIFYGFGLFVLSNYGF